MIKVAGNFFKPMDKMFSFLKGRTGGCALAMNDRESSTYWQNVL